MGAIKGEDLMNCTKTEDGNNTNEEKILVLVRLRPLSENEIAKNEESDWECIDEKTILLRNNNLQEKTTHIFDKVFGDECSTRKVYEEGAKAIALSVVSGINSSILAYGQTSSGKTYTMSGIMEYTVADIYDYIHKHEERAFVVKFSAMEIYNEVVRDLLSTGNTPLRVRDDPEKGAFVENLNEELLRDWGHLEQLLSICEAQRKVEETSLNKASSRSHQIVRLTVESSAREFLGKENSTALSASLAVSEFLRHRLLGERLKEGCHINSSLFTLGNVIRKLSKGRNGHVSYRDSKLTRILQPCLGGNARTAIVCTLSPSRAHLEQSKNTLFFASCAKEVSTNAKVNVIMSDKALLKRLQHEVIHLRDISSACNCAVLLREKDLQIEKLEEMVTELSKQRDLAESRVEELQLIIEKYQTSTQLGGIENSSEWRNQWIEVPCIEKNEPMEYKSSESIASSTGEDEGILALMMQSYSNEVFKSSSSSEEEAFISKLKNQNLSKQWDLAETEGDDLLSVVGNYQTQRELGGKYDSPQWQDRCVDVPFNETNESTAKEEGTSTIMVQMYGNEVSESLTHREEEENTRVSRLRNQKLNRSTRFRSSKPLSRAYSLSYDMFSQKGSLHSIGSVNEMDNQNDSTQSGVDFPSILNFVSEIKEMAKMEYEKKVANSQGTEPEAETLTNWALVFVRQQKAILELWHVCNISLVHRTYFFLLFKGDPTDSIYMEIELRRLSFLNEAFSRGKNAGRGDQVLTLESSVEAIHREKDMLMRLMHKRFSRLERDKLFKKCGINLESKKRKIQFVNLLWSNTNDLNHVTESAKIVGKLIGFSEQGATLKEMFGLSLGYSGKIRSKSSFAWN